MLKKMVLRKLNSDCGYKKVNEIHDREVRALIEVLDEIMIGEKNDIDNNSSKE